MLFDKWLRSNFSNYFRCEFSRTGSVNTDELTFAAFVLKFNETFDQREQCVVFTDADVVAGLPFGAALTSEDVAAENVLAAKFLEPKPLCMRIATVSG